MKITVKELREIIAEAIEECGCQMKQKRAMEDDTLLLVPLSQDSVMDIVDEAIAGFDKKFQPRGKVSRDNISPEQAPQQSPMAEARRQKKRPRRK